MKFQGLRVESPNGRLVMTVDVTGGRPEWSLALDGQTVVEPSAAGVEFEGATFVDNLDVVESGTLEQRTFSCERRSGKRRSSQAIGHCHTLTLTNSDGAQVALDVVVFDDAAAHRFRQLDVHGATAETSTAVTLPSNATKFAQPYDRVSEFQPASEALYFGPVPASFTRPLPEGWSFPMLYDTAGVWTLLTQTAVDGWSDGLRLRNDIGSTTHQLVAPPTNQFDGPITETPVEPITLPWTLLIVGDDLDTVVASDAVELLAAPSAVDNTDWIRPGRVSWSWWSDSDSPQNPDSLRAFIDFAAEVGWEYSLIDANWNLMPEGTIESLVAYAAERNVGLFLWYNSGGPHNRVTEQPRDRMHLRERRRQEMRWLSDLGVAGLKVDFFQGDRASMNRLALEMLEDAAEFELLMNFHGITSPKGWHATWPHLLTTEAVRGAEQYKFDPWFPLTAPSLHTMLAFTRNVVGPMDYTPMTLSDVDFAHRTTNAHELALGVVFESGLQHPADKPDAYRSLGERGLDLLRRLPVVWDETRVLEGAPAHHAVFARRHEDSWWIAGINGLEDPLSSTIDLSAFGDGDWWLARDGADAHSVVFEQISGPTVDVEMARVGGFVLWPV